MRAALSRSLPIGSPSPRAEIHSPLYSPGTQTPVVMRHCGRFGAVSKTVVGLTVHRGFESLPLRFRACSSVDLQEIRRLTTYADGHLVAAEGTGSRSRSAPAARSRSRIARSSSAALQ